MQARLHLPWEDGLSTLVAVSGEVVAIHGKALERFNHSEAVESMLVVPVKQDDKISTIITVARKTPQPFSHSQRAMLEFVAQFTSVLLENIQHFRLMEQNLLFLQHSNLYSIIESDLKYNLLLQASTELRSPLKNLVDSVDSIFNKSDRRLNREQAIALKDIQEEAEILMDIADSMVRIRQDNSSSVLEAIDLNEVVCNVVIHFQPIAQMAQINIKQDLPTMPTMIKVYLSQITKVIEGLLSNALKYSPLNGLVTIRVEQRDGSTFVKVEDQGELIDERLAESVFDKKSGILGYAARRYGGLGISLPMIKEIVTAYKGNIWIERKPESGFCITFSLPRT
jgi:K+-sensing histidine kinase KdpD